MFKPKTLIHPAVIVLLINMGIPLAAIATLHLGDVIDQNPVASALVALGLICVSALVWFVRFITRP